MNIEQAKTIPISLILDKINFKAQKTNKDEVLYFSPLRNEETPSFWVNLTKNIWHDFGNGQGGDIIDFAVSYLDSQGMDHAVSDGLRYLQNMSGLIPMIEPIACDELTSEKNTLVLKNVKAIGFKALIHYGEKRGIPETILRRYMKEASVLNKKSTKTMSLLCMKNEENGYELRNSIFKGHVGKQGITFVRGTHNNYEGIHIFKGVFDFLSVIAQQEGEPLKDDSIILHSLINIRQGAAYIKGFGYRTGYTWMDNDDYGRRAIKSWTDFFAKEDNCVHMPMNDLYEDSRDVNEAHMKKLGLTPEVV